MKSGWFYVLPLIGDIKRVIGQLCIEEMPSDLDLCHWSTATALVGFQADLFLDFSQPVPAHPMFDLVAIHFSFEWSQERAHTQPSLPSFVPQVVILCAHSLLFVLCFFLRTT